MTESATPAKLCFDHHHLSPNYGFLSVCRALYKAKGRNLLLFDGRKMAARFGKMSKDTAYNYAKALTATGWLKVVKESERLPSGRMSKTEYKVLDHDEWAAEHPNSCNQPVEKTGQVKRVKAKASPVYISDVTCLTSTQSLSNFPVSPVEESGHNLQLLTHKEKHTGTTDAAARASSSSFIRRFSPETVVSHARVYSAPVENQGQVVSDTPRNAEEIAVAVAINLRLGNGLASNREPWERAVRHLSERGHSSETILAVFGHYADTHSVSHVRQNLAHGFEQNFAQSLKEFNTQTNQTEAA